MSAEAYLEVADMLLFDAKTPKEMTNALPGGNAVSFDWTILSGRDWPLPWMLSGGLDPANVGEAIDIYVNNRLVARGEVVVVDDKLGVTMTEIIKSDQA